MRENPITCVIPTSTSLPAVVCRDKREQASVPGSLSKSAPIVTERWVGFLCSRAMWGGGPLQGGHKCKKTYKFWLDMCTQPCSFCMEMNVSGAEIQARHRDLEKYFWKVHGFTQI